MPVTVVDASALGAVLFDEPEGSAIRARIAGLRLTAPLLLGFEIANICATKIRKEPHRKAEHLAVVEVFRRLAVAEVPVDHVQVVRLADQSGLTTYDASYLWLSLELRADLVTLDKALQRAARRSRDA